MAEKETIEKSDVALMPAEILESVPKVEGKNVADEVEEKFDWSPVETPKILAHLDKLGSAIIKIKNIEHYRNPGKNPYVAFRTGPRRGVACIYLGKTARLSLGQAVVENGKAHSEWPKHLIFKVTESGINRDGESVTTKEITQKVRAFIKARWK